MAQIEIKRLPAFSAFRATGRAEAKGQNQVRSALPYSRWVGARVARQRCPILHPSRWSLPDYPPFAKGTSLLCIIGDISTLP